MRSGYMGDLDQDGKPDIYYNDYRAQAILDLEYQGGPVTDPNSWMPYEIIILPGVRFGNVRPAGDLDGDGLEELVCNMGGLRNGQNLMILESQHTASFVSQKGLEKPSGYTLYQNYPNPFNPTTEISYQLKKPSHVKLEIFTILGQNIATLVDDFRSEGKHKVKFDAADLPSDIYVYRILTDEFVDQKKMVLIR